MSRGGAGGAVGCLAVLWGAFCALLGIGWLAFLVWAIYELVTWLTAK